jgi:rhomboid protease GluP
MSGRARTIRDLDQGNNRLNNQGLLGGNQGGEYPILNSSRFGGTPEEARKETFWQMLKFIFCPYFTMRSFIFIITIIDVLMYIITVFYEYDTNEFLQPKISTLIKFGAKDPSKMHGYEIWRWFTPSLLHLNLMHLFSNMIMQLILGSRLEPTVGLWRTIVVYEVSGFGGVLFSSLVSDGIAVGASTCLFGLLSSMIVWVIMNWNRLPDSPYKIFALVWLIMMLIFNIMMGVSSEHIDNWGHFGGMITGAPLALVLFKYVGAEETKQQKMTRYLAAGFLGFYFILGICLFYTVV